MSLVPLLVQRPNMDKALTVQWRKIVITMQDNKGHHRDTNKMSRDRKAEMNYLCLTEFAVLQR